MLEYCMTNPPCDKCKEGAYNEPSSYELARWGRAMSSSYLATTYIFRLPYSSLWFMGDNASCSFHLSILIPTIRAAFQPNLLVALSLAWSRYHIIERHSGMKDGNNYRGKYMLHKESQNINVA